MLSKSIFRLTGIVLVVALATLLIGVLNARPVQRKGESDLVRTYSRHVRTTLDDERTQLWYMKTTDYGATWSHFTQAGDISTFSPSRGLMPDFCTVTTATNEICFTVYLDSTATQAARGVYSFTGPNFQPVLVMAAGTNILNTVGGTNPKGWTSVGKDPNGNLYCVIWGLTAAPASLTTFWGAKSTDNGATWGTPFIVAQEPNIDHSATYPHLAQMNSTTNVFIIYQSTGTAGYDQHVGKFPVAGGAASFVGIGSTTEPSRNYYVGSCQPLAYDNGNNALYACYLTDVSGLGVTVYYSSDQGQTFTAYNLAVGKTRYPSIALNAASQYPYIVSNVGPPAIDSVHYAWLTYDQLGYGSGSWVVPPVRFANAPGPYTNPGPLLYCNEMYWWDANRGAAVNSLWGARTPEGCYVEHTTNGGATYADWSPILPLWIAADDSIDPATANMNQIAGGTNGIAYVTTSFALGSADVSAPVVAQQTLITPFTSTGPYLVSAVVSDDRGVGASTINWTWHPADGDTVRFQDFDSVHVTDPATQSGTYFYTIPDSDANGHHWANGDTIWFFADATDGSGNYTAHDTQAIVVGSAYLGVTDHASPTVGKFALLGNYPNPFNPTTQIRFELSAMSRVTLKVFNILGENVATLADGQMLEQGRHALTFDGSSLSSGIYFYTLTAGTFVASQKMVLLK